MFTTNRGGPCHSFDIVKEIGRGLQMLPRQHDNRRCQASSGAEAGSASGKGQGTQDALQGLLRLGGRWQSPCITAPPCPDWRKDLPAQRGAPSPAGLQGHSPTPTPKVTGRSPADGIFMGGNAWNAVQKGIWMNEGPWLAPGCTPSSGESLGACTLLWLQPHSQHWGTRSHSAA